jgi:anti-sigma28 factor (negative regulator of flagellin synthesis)
VPIPPSRKKLFLGGGAEIQSVSSADLQDTLTVSSACGVAALKAKTLSMPEVREDRIVALRERVQKGEYKVAAESIA